MRHTPRVDDLKVPPGPGSPAGLRVPAEELTEQFSRSSGPGGQGVNTTDSRVQLSLDLATTTALDDAQRTRALARLEGRLVGTVLTVSASEHRSQRQNRAAARERMAALLREALIAPIPRRATKPTKGSQRRRAAAKRQRSETTRLRRRPGPE
ncbi:MAG: alternative ribosome rescue aminoacyl-tRNA hydrolase ArfB [Nocardioides sp.]